MKLTDFALIFVAIFLPIVVLVYINTAFVVKAEKQEMYYKNIMNSAITDAVSAMKQVENEDPDIDYGYSGIIDNKVSVNAKVAISTFYNSLANNFNIKDNEVSLERLKMYIPVIAIMDYDGIYIHSAETNADEEISFITKPKVHYTYSYVILEENPLYDTSYKMVSLEDISDIASVREQIVSDYIFEVNFTMDDYIYLNIYKISSEDGKNIMEDIEVSTAFYLNDENNNHDLVTYDIPSEERAKIKSQIIKKLQEKRQEVIAEIGMKEISYAVNKHNEYAKNVGISYTFRFAVESDSAWYETMDGIGMIAVIQGISLGNRYLNYKAYSASDLIVTKKYFVSKGVTIEGKDTKYLAKDLYHISDKCTAYKQYISSTREELAPSYYSNKADAATQGFYPCPVCKP